MSKTKSTLVDTTGFEGYCFEGDVLMKLNDSYQYLHFYICTYVVYKNTTKNNQLLYIQMHHLYFNAIYTLVQYTCKYIRAFSVYVIV